MAVAPVPPFTREILETPYPEKFKILRFPIYDGTIDTDENLENYQTLMLI